MYAIALVVLILVGCSAGGRGGWRSCNEDLVGKRIDKCFRPLDMLDRLESQAWSFSEMEECSVLAAMLSCLGGVERQCPGSRLLRQLTSVQSLADLWDVYLLQCPAIN